MKPQKSEPIIIKTTAKEIQELRIAIEQSDFSARHKELLLTMIEEIISVKNTEKEKQVQLAKLRRTLNPSSEKRSNKESDSNNKERKTPKKNHGRISADDYKPSKVVEHKHESLKAGVNCPECNHGTLQQLRSGKVLKIVGATPIEAHLHEPERLRCGGCLKIFTASLPSEVSEEKADPSACSTVAVFRFAMGVPHYRLAAFQRASGVPLPASTQYEMIETLWTCVTPIYKALLYEAANASIIYADDTPAKIIDFMVNKKALKEAGKRVGVFSTAIVAKNNGQIIHLFFTGQNHAGENLGELLDARLSGSSPPIQMTDASSCNFKNDAMTIVSLCLVHGRRNFIDCENAFPDEASYVIERIALVYKNEKYIKSQGMNDDQRLDYHIEHSLEPMNEIKQFAETSMNDKKVEPNSSLGSALKYMMKHWEGLTRFLTTPGAPIDNNQAELLVKKFIMYKKNSYFYKNENGARVGDCLMSIIHTCLAADENPIDYLTTLQKHKGAVAKNSKLWLPWNYRKMLKSVSPQTTN